MTQIVPGMHIGRGTVMEAPVMVKHGSGRRPGARLRCDCGNIYETRISHLVADKNGRINTMSCGCLNRERSRAQGLANTRNHVEVGQRIGRGVVIDPDVRVTEGAESDLRGARLRCDCGNIYETRISHLIEHRDGKISVLSCGCLRREMERRSKNVQHGMSGHPLYNTWSTMMRRCYSPKNPKYRRYGGRGILVHESWHDVRIFVADLEREIGPKPGQLYSLDRWPDNDGNYEPGNVRWATAAEQTANREYQLAMAFLSWARTVHPEVVAEWATRAQ